MAIPRAVVIGGGLAGLAAAAALAGRGHAVTVLEAHDTVGGKARAVRASGAIVDTGPTLLTDPGPLRRLFEAAGQSLDDMVPLERVEPGLHVTFPGGRSLALHADAARMAGALDRLGPHARADWDRLLALGARAHRLAAHYHARGDVLGARDLLTFALRGRTSPRDIWPFARHRSLDRLVRAEIRTLELRRLLAHGARFVGLDAARAPSMAWLVPYLLVVEGVWYPRGGVSALAEAVAALAIKAGAEIACGQAVRGLERRAGRITAAVTHGGRRVVADLWVSAVDVGVTAGWVGGAWAHGVARLTPALSARIAWWVTEGGPARPHHHALDFGPDPMDEPLYVATPTVTEPALARSGATVLYALEHGEAGRPPGHGFAERLRARLVATGHWPSGRVLSEGVAGGESSCYGYRIGPGLFGSLRPSQRVPGLANLFLAGGSVFPGPGVANVIRSGVRAAALAHDALAQGAA